MNKTKRIIIAGGTGFLGSHLESDLAAAGYAVVVLTRNPRRRNHIFWDGKHLGLWKEQIDGAYAIINLAGKNVNCRYTAANRKEINASRVDSVNILAQACKAVANPPQVWIQASSLAIYGDTGERLCDETTPPGLGFPVETCLLWENAFDQVQAVGLRKVILRIGFVLANGEGALGTLEKLVKCFLGGTVGTGRQGISWIHWKDLNNIFIRALADSAMSGIYNATGLNPVTNRELMKSLRQALGRPWSPPAPRPMLEIGAFLMRTESCLALTGRKGEPRRLLETGFNFQYRHLPQALAEIYGLEDQNSKSGSREPVAGTCS